jgi:hypothetical protein
LIVSANRNPTLQFRNDLAAVESADDRVARLHRAQPLGTVVDEHGAGLIRLATV